MNFWYLITRNNFSRSIQYIPTSGLGEIIDIRRPGGSIRLRGHRLEILVTPDVIGRHMKRENNAEMAEQNMEVVEDNFRLRNAVKSLKEQLEKAGMGTSCGNHNVVGK